MNTTAFRTGGALTDDHADIYIERQADRKALTHLRSMDYLLVIEPRQQGKTSLINHLLCHPGLEDVAFVYVDVTTPDRSSETTWYQTLCRRILRQLQGFMPRDQRPPVPQKSTGWREFLCEVAICATDAHKRVVMALDEIGAVTFPGATEFFSVLRDVYNSRQAEIELKQLTFLLAGAFHPRDLIKDDKISPFNIAQRVRLDDFTPEQVLELVKKGHWSEDQTVALAQRICYWTDGQPYLTQLLCSYLGPDAGPADVDTGITRLRREDENHLPPLMDRLEKEEKLLQYVERILSGERIKFYPREHRRQAELELLGVIKQGPEGYCVIRNRLYRQVLMGTLEQQVEPVPRRSSAVPDVERIYSLRVNAAFDEVWRCLVYTRDQEDSSWATQSRLWWSIDEKDHSKSTKSATVLLGINWPSAASIYDFNERRLHLFQGVQGWTVIEVHADLAAESQSDPEATELFDDFLASFVKMFERLGYEVSRMNNQANSTQGKAYSRPGNGAHRELIDALERRSLALFIGADLPRDATGLPSRAGLARELARRKGLDESLSLAEVAQRVARGGNRWEFTNFIRDQFDTTGKSPQPFHRRIVELVQEHEIKALVTTAYDNLLELAFQDAGMPINRVVRGSDVSFIDPSRPTLIKLYGDIQQPNTLVVTEDDHYDLGRDRDKEDLLHEVKTVLRRQTVLFLGYNLADPDFNLLWREVLDRAGRFNRTAYAVWPGLSDSEVQIWRDRGIVILDEDPMGVLDIWKDNAGSGLAKVSSSGSLPPEETLYLDTTAELFVQWLADHTQMVPYRNFSTEKGRLVLQGIRPPHSIQSPTTLSMEAIYIVPQADRDAEKGMPIGSAITFRVIPLSSERIEVEAKCHQPAVAGYSRELLAEIRQRWPVKETVSDLKSEPSPSDPPGSRPAVRPSIGDKDMDYKCGFQTFKECIAGANTEAQSELATLEERFWKNQRAERVFGSSENTRNERSQIIFSLNELALKHCGVSFNELCQGAQPVPSEQPVSTEQSEPSLSRRERTWVHFKLQVTWLTGLEFEVRALETPMGEPRTTSHLPYDYDDVIAILKALPVSSIEAASLKSSQVDALRELGLLTEGSLVSDLHVRAGRSLYQSLFPGDVGAAFQMAWNQVRAQRSLVSLQLRFDEDAVALARYPWEILYYRRHLLTGGAVQLTRYVSYPESPTALSIEPPLQVLYVESRPTDLKSLPVGKEQEAVGAALEDIEEKGSIVLESLSPATYDALIDRVERNEDHVLHFDGHGTVARRCPDCDAMNYPHQTSCQRPGCDRILTDVPPLGYLAFEKEGTRNADWVDSKALENLLYPSTVRVAVLSACRSGEVRGETLFGGVGPALIQAGVPAVVAMQVPVTVQAATRFMRGFYGALARFESLPAAVTSGRRRLFRGREWFIPALYLRSQDDEGQLLKPS